MRVQNCRTRTINHWRPQRSRQQRRPSRRHLLQQKKNNAKSKKKEGNRGRRAWRRTETIEVQEQEEQGRASTTRVKEEKEQEEEEGLSCRAINKRAARSRLAHSGRQLHDYALLSASRSLPQELSWKLSREGAFQFGGLRSKLHMPLEL